MLAQKPRIVVYNKLDLSLISPEQKRIVKTWDDPATVLFQNTKQGFSISALLQCIKQKVSYHGISVQGVRILVLGMPNVGKSTILNALRHVSLKKGKAAKTGAQPGITRSTNSIFKVLDDPTTYLIDTPGIMIPFVPNSTTMLKLGLVNCIKDSIIDPITLADYLLFVLNLNDNGTSYSEHYRTCSTNEIEGLLAEIGKRKGKLKRGGEVDIDAAAKVFIQDFRDGKLGQICLDAIFPGALQERIEEEGMYLSKSQVRKGVELKSAKAAV